MGTLGGKRQEEIKCVCSINSHWSIYTHTHTSKVSGALTRQGAQEAAGSTEGGKLKSASHAQKENLAETTQETEHVF